MSPWIRPHRKSWDCDGRAHFLTFSCFRKQRFFDGQRSPQWFLDAMEIARQASPFDLWAWVIMPNHVHLVLLPRDGVRIRQILWRLKRPVTSRCLRWVQGHSPAFLARMADERPSGAAVHRFWLRGGGYDRTFRSVRDVHEKIRYIHNNPVRWGLVDRAEDWPWSSARAWATGSDEPVRIDRESVPPLEE